ncbi:MAG: hypothetical protein OEY49_10050 [Candidatus Heimdallarchaeota archaeon]|nr:hypothetical protein [Candidatus Heimdallarchaeota archaeon]
MGRKKKVRSETIELKAKIPIDLTVPKIYSLADVPFNQNHWNRVYRMFDGEIFVARITQTKPLSKFIQVTIESQTNLASYEKEYIARIRHEIGMDETMQALRSESKKDSLINFAAQAYPGMRLYANSQVHEAAILAIFSQNTSLFNYLQTTRQFVNKFGTKVEWDDSLTIFPSAAEIANLEETDWKSLNIGYKVDFLKNLTVDILEDIGTYTFYPIAKRGLDNLLEIQGIGDYTARSLFIYAARRYEYAFMDSFVRELLNHKYNIIYKMTTRDFDKWIKNKWKKDPALILHTLLLEYFPQSLLSIDTDNIK